MASGLATSSETSSRGTRRSPASRGQLAHGLLELRRPRSGRARAAEAAHGGPGPEHAPAPARRRPSPRRRAAPSQRASPWPPGHGRCSTGSHRARGATVTAGTGSGAQWPPHRRRRARASAGAGSSGSGTAPSAPRDTTNLSATSHHSPARSGGGHARQRARQRPGQRATALPATWPATAPAAAASPQRDVHQRACPWRSFLPLLLRLEPGHDVLELLQLLVADLLGLGQVGGEGRQRARQRPLHEVPHHAAQQLRRRHPRGCTGTRPPPCAA